MGIKTYIYRREAANDQTRLVTSNGGHPIPSNSEVVVVFPKNMSDAETESYLEKLNTETSNFLNVGLRRYVFVCGERIPVEMYQSHRQSPGQGKPLSLQVQQWLNGQISQRGEEVVPIISSRISSAPLTTYLDQDSNGEVIILLDDEDNNTGAFNLTNNQAEESSSSLLVSPTTTTTSSSHNPGIDQRLSSLIRNSHTAISSTLSNTTISSSNSPARIEALLSSLIRNSHTAISSALGNTTISSSNSPARIEELLGSLIRSSLTEISSALTTMGYDSNHATISEARENQSGIAAYDEELRSLDKDETKDELDSESEVQPEHEVEETEMTRFGARAKRLVGLDIAEEPSNPMIINQLRNVRQKWFKEEVARILENHRSKLIISNGEYAIDFDTMQEEVEERTSRLNTAVHNAKKKRAFPVTAANLDREDNRSAEQYSKDCKNLASQICQRVLKELQQDSDAEKIVVLFSRGEKGQPSEKVVKPRANYKVGVGGSIEGKYDLEFTQWHQKRNSFFQHASVSSQKQSTGRKTILDDVTQNSVQGAGERQIKRRKINPEGDQVMFSFDVDLYLNGKRKDFSAQQIAEIWGHKKFLGKPDSFHLERLKRLIEETTEEEELILKP